MSNLKIVLYSSILCLAAFAAFPSLITFAASDCPCLMTVEGKEILNSTFETDLEKAAHEYFSTWEARSLEELPDGVVIPEFDSEAEAYQYLTETGELSIGDIYVIGDKEVTEAEFYAFAEDDDADNDVLPVSGSNSSSKVVARRKFDKGKLELVVDYDIEKENGRKLITSVDAHTVEKDIPDSYDIIVDSVNVAIKDGRRRAAATAKGHVERSVLIKGVLRTIISKLNMNGSVRV